MSGLNSVIDTEPLTFDEAYSGMVLAIEEINKQNGYNYNPYKIIHFTGEITGNSVTEQAEQVIRNISEVLKESGSDFSKVIKTTCFLRNMSDFSDFNNIYSKYFTGKPARSCVEVSALPKGALVEIEVIAGI
jgi:reactive intermediate/imine deaminase